jgi:hypothetical protein
LGIQRRGSGPQRAPQTRRSSRSPSPGRWLPSVTCARLRHGCAGARVPGAASNASAVSTPRRCRANHPTDAHQIATRAGQSRCMRVRAGAS